MSFCRITGKARSLPKPNFFPIIPPISPADAQKLCRVTGKRDDDHNYVPLLEVGRRPESVRCLVTGKNLNRDKARALALHAAGENTNDRYENNVVGETTGGVFGPHSTHNDYKYVEPVLKREAMEKGDASAFEDLMKVLRRIKKEMKEDGKDENELSRKYVYLLPSMLCGLVLPAEAEEAIRRGDLEAVSLSKSCEKAIFKVKGKRTLFVPLSEVDLTAGSTEEGSPSQLLYDGRGQSKETLNRQRQAIDARRKKNLVHKKVFEDLEKKAEAQMQKEEKEKASCNKASKADRKGSKRAREYRQKIQDFREKYSAEHNMSEYGDFRRALKTNLHSVDWEKIGRLAGAEAQALDVAALPKRMSVKNLSKQLSRKQKRVKSVYVPDQPGLELVPIVEDFSVDPLHISKKLLDFIVTSKDRGKRGSSSSSSSSPPVSCTSSLKSMFACEESLKILPKLSEFEDIAASGKLNTKGLKMGCMYDRGDGVKFAEDPSEVAPGANVILGAVVDVDGMPKFVPGEMVADGEFVAGQRMNSANGEFIPGASIRGDDGRFHFIPGVISGRQGKFTAGQFVQEGDEGESTGGQLRFVRGQVVHTANGAKFVEGETISTADGLKFVAG